MNYLEILYLLLISTSGYLFLNYLCKQPQPLSISLSLPVGSVVFVIFILLFFMRYFIAYAIFWSILICFSVYSSHRKTTDQISNKKTLHSKLYISLFVASTIAMLAIFSGKSFLVLSFDSKGMIFFGNVIESFGYIPEAFLKFTARPVGGNLSLRPVFLPMLQAGSAFFDLNYSAAYFPLCFLSLNFLLWYCLTTLTHHMKKNREGMDMHVLDWINSCLCIMSFCFLECILLQWSYTFCHLFPVLHFWGHYGHTD